MTSWRTWLIAALAATTLTWVIVTARGAAATTPTSDIAVIETFTRLAARANLTLGPYSRFQWHHPGPIAFYAMAPVYALAGMHTAALSAAALVLNLAAMLVALVCLARRASATLAVSVSMAIALLLFRVPEILTSPWNAHLPVLAILAAMVTAAAGATGSTWACLATVAFASLAGQTHVGLIPVALSVGAIATAGLMVSRPSSGAAFGGIAAATAALWALPLFETLTTTPGNMGLIVTDFVYAPHTTPSFGVALSAWADMMAGVVRPDFYLAHGWKFVESPVEWAEALALTQLLVLVVAGAEATRQRRYFDAAFSVTLLTASIVALMSVTRIDGDIFDHAVFWMSALGTLNLGVAAALLIRAVARLARIGHGRRDAQGPPATQHAQAGRRPNLAAISAVLSMSAAIVLGATALRAEVARSRTPNAESQAAADVAAALQRVLAAEHMTRPLIRFDQDAWGMVAGVVLQLQREGVPVAVEDDWMAMYTPAFKATGVEQHRIAIVGRVEHVRRSADPTNRLLASSHDLLFAYTTR